MFKVQSEKVAGCGRRFGVGVTVGDGRCRSVVVGVTVGWRSIFRNGVGRSQCWWSVGKRQTVETIALLSNITEDGVVDVRGRN
jgi:hypothetical protein